MKTKIKIMLASLLMLGLILVPGVKAAPQDTQWYKDQAVQYFIDTHPEYTGQESKWSVWVISPLYALPANHRNVMIEYNGEYTLLWTGHVWEDGSGADTVQYHSTYTPPTKTTTSIKLLTTIVNPHYRFVWTVKGWQINPGMVSYWSNGRFIVYYPKP